MVQKEIMGDFNALPPEGKKQVIDFIAFLKSRYKTDTKNRVKPKNKIADEAFVGIWKNREDMQDSQAWVRKTRTSEWE